MLRWIVLFFPVLLSAAWPEETLAQMTLDEKIGQLFVAPACPLRQEDHWADWLKILHDCHIGNVIVKQSDPATQIQFLNRLQAESNLPLLVVADAEWGLAMRMSDTIAFPRNMTLGAIADLDLIYQMGREIGRQASLVGIHLNLAPVADVNNNPANPVIHMRSFGEDPAHVAACVSAYARGLQAAGTLACAKHFPGHGDTHVDSHADLPVIRHSLQRLQSVEWVPFHLAVEGGIFALMTAHLYVPALDPIYPTSLSPTCLKVVRDLLHFDGLLISDALNMKAIADRYSSDEIALLAHKAGCDLLLYGDHKDPNVDALLRTVIPLGFHALKRSYLAGEFDVKTLDAIVLRILRAKETLIRSFPSERLSESLHTEGAANLKKRLFEEAVTLIGEPAFPVPGKTAYLSIGENDVLAPEFQKWDSYEAIVIAIHQKEALTEEVLEKIEAFSEKAVLCLFTTPYLLNHFKNWKTILVGYENDPDAQRAVLRILKGEKQAKGHLPISIDGPL